MLVPEAVYTECVIDGKGREDAHKIRDASWILVTEIKNIDLKKALNVSLDEGESEVIALALQERADLVIPDDYEAREFARTYNLKITVSLGPDKSEI